MVTFHLSSCKRKDLLDRVLPAGMKSAALKGLLVRAPSLQAAAASSITPAISSRNEILAMLVQKALPNSCNTGAAVSLLDCAQCNGSVLPCLVAKGKHGNMKCMHFKANFQVIPTSLLALSSRPATVM